MSGADDMEDPAWRPRRRKCSHPLRQGRQRRADLRVKDELSLGHAESVGWKDIPRQRPEDIVLLVQTSRTRLTLRLSTLPPSEAGPTQAVGAEQSSMGSPCPLWATCCAWLECDPGPRLRCCLGQRNTCQQLNKSNSSMTKQ